MTSFDADLFRRMLDTSPEGLVLVDAQHPDHPVIYVNPAFEALTGYTAAELKGRNLRLLQADDREQDGRQRLRDALRAAKPAACCCEITARMGRCFGTK